MLVNSDLHVLGLLSRMVGGSTGLVFQSSWLSTGKMTDILVQSFELVHARVDLFGQECHTTHTYPSMG